MSPLDEIESAVRRGCFSNTYLYAAPGEEGSSRAFPGTERPKRDARNQWPRLMDCCLSTASITGRDCADDPMPEEFAVVDVVTKEKGFFEMPSGCTPEIVKALVESHFHAPAFRVGPRLWFV